jgi:glucokinase
MGQILIGIDVGGTTTAGGLFTSGGDVVDVLQVPTHQEGPGTAVDTLLGVVGDLVAEAHRRGLDPAGIGVGIPGVVDPGTGAMALFPNHVPELGGVRLAERIEAKTGLPAFIDNDVNALALAEWRFGLGRGAASLVLLAIGTGVGGGIILDGHLVRGRRGYGGELGHVPINVAGPVCMCGCRGCVAVYLGGASLAQRARELDAGRPGSVLRALAGGDPAAITSELVFRAAAAGDAAMQSLVSEACEALAASLGGVLNALNPDVVVVTGGVAASLIPLREDVLGRLRGYALQGILETTAIHFVGADKQRTALGGGALVLYELARRSVGSAHRED